MGGVESITPNGLLIMNKLRKVFTRKRLLIGSLCISFLCLGVSIITTVNMNRELQSNFRVVMTGESDACLLQERTCGGYYIYQGNYIKPLEKPKSNSNFNQSTTIVDNLGGEQNGKH